MYECEVMSCLPLDVGRRLTADLTLEHGFAAHGGSTGRWLARKLARCFSYIIQQQHMYVVCQLVCVISHW